MRELQGRWPGLHGGRWEVGGGSSVVAQGSYGRLRELRCAGWLESTQQGTPAGRGGASLRGRWVGCRLAVPPARSASAASMQSPPASAEATSVIILSTVFARPRGPAEIKALLDEFG